MGKRIAIIGAGAAGCFCAAELSRSAKDVRVTVFEAGRKPLAKVAITGGGRCNLTNSFEEISDLRQAYPRGARLMERAFHRFDHNDAWTWFEEQGVPLVLQEDCCVFPQSQDAMDIVRCLSRPFRAPNIELRTSCRVASISHLPSGQFRISIAPASSGKIPDQTGENAPIGAVVREMPGPEEVFDAVVVTTGGSPNGEIFKVLEPLGIETIEPVPSLFTFNVNDKALRALTGTVVEDAEVFIPGTKFSASGPLLITHWGLSGPAVLKLSSYAARHLAEKGYNEKIRIRWVQDSEEIIDTIAQANPQKKVFGTHPAELNARLWEMLCTRAGLRNDIRWAELGAKSRAHLKEVIENDIYTISGKGAFKEEFVTCGGVSLDAININTLESKKHPGLFFAGEVLDIDAITGGFNLQAAWTTAYIAASCLQSS